MSSRPECEVCYQHISMGTCACGFEEFGSTVSIYRALRKWPNAGVLKKYKDDDEVPIDVIRGLWFKSK